ncbi:cytochrome P450 [Sphaerosporella brunnea]|uniref:Cytochrome P450 n=1 Tax=Sphaerosporella brunnea TaxID=1250544 RepID=A0A5J5EJI0_9PEZI|nr:cytochrome P450 [Sphaerosporella brunnea]
MLKRLVRYVDSPMRKQGIPGPFLAGYTSWYRAFYADITHNWHDKLVQLHDEYGPIVWIAPDEVSVSDPKLRGVLYSFADERREESFFPKAKSFETGLFNNDFNFVFETDPARARIGKYALSHPYSEKGLAKLEHHFDEAVQAFTEGFTEHVVSTNTAARLNAWAHFFMFDLATLLMSGYSRGLCLDGKDSDGAIRALRDIFNVVGALVPVSFALKISTKAIRKAILNSRLEHLFSWSIGYQNGESHKNARINEVSDKLPNNLMAKFRAGEKKIRKLFPDGNWTEAITNNVFFIYAGSMVASNALPMVIRYIYSDKRVLDKIREELAGYEGPIKMSEIAHVNGHCNLPYLEAAILEALRLNPTFGISLGRTVPSIGCKLNEFFIPRGYVVSMSPWATNIDKDYFGEDAREFRPERWLGNHPTELAKDDSGAPRTMRNYIEAGWFSFGAGARVCIGRHFTEIAFMKFVGSMVRNFEVEVVNPGYVWYGLIQHAEDVMVKATVREDTKPAVEEVVAPEAIVAN